MRILYVSGEVAPFTETSESAHLARTLPELISEAGDYETRIMMPRYGTISERRNRLHEVIRLSGAEIPVNGDTETLKVKVASIPGIRLQVYFMDNKKLFKRKGIFASKNGKTFEDNPQRALFFGRAVLETLKKLRWGPDVIHAFGWMSGFLPMLLETEYADEPVFENTKCVFTPEAVDFEAPLTADLVSSESLPAATELAGKDANTLGLEYASAVIFPPSMEPTDDQPQLSGDDAAMAEQVIALYDQINTSVPA